MIERLIDLLKDGWDWLSPFFICFPYEGGVVLRDGAYRRMLTVGFNLKWPMREYVVHCYTCEDTERLPWQVLTTRDGVQVKLKSIVRYRISNPRLFLLHVQDQKTAIEDVTMGLTREIVESMLFKALIHTPWNLEVAAKLRKRVARYGVQILQVTYSDLGKQNKMHIELEHKRGK